jgi:predicted DNA-binding transcriptional regulator AlpA
MDTPDRLLTIDEAAEILATSRDFLYHNWARLPFAIKLSPKQLRFSLQGIMAYIEEMQHGKVQS